MWDYFSIQNTLATLVQDIGPLDPSICESAYYGSKSSFLNLVLNGVILGAGVGACGVFVLKGQVKRIEDKFINRFFITRAIFQENKFTRFLGMEPKQIGLNLFDYNFFKVTFQGMLAGGCIATCFFAKEYLIRQSCLY